KGIKFRGGGATGFLAPPGKAGVRSCPGPNSISHPFTTAASCLGSDPRLALGHLCRARHSDWPGIRRGFIGRPFDAAGTFGPIMRSELWRHHAGSTARLPFLVGDTFEPSR